LTGWLWVRWFAVIRRLSSADLNTWSSGGKTPVLSPEEAHELFAGIPTDTLIGLRDRALIGVLIYSFARISAALGMSVSDYFPQGKRWWLRLHEKGGKQHEMPVHHTLEEYLDRYIEAGGIREDKKGPLFRSAYFKTGRLTTQVLTRDNAFRMIQRRSKKAGIRTKIGCHTFRATGITIYLTNGGDLEKAQQMAAHESPRTTKLYDRRSDVVSLDEVEKVVVLIKAPPIQNSQFATASSYDHQAIRRTRTKFLTP
jgi:integrase